jgi:fructokinase
MFDVVTLGELLIDLVADGRETGDKLFFEANPGGAPANVAATLAKLGKRCAFLGMVGNDQFGIFLRNILAKNGIDVTGLKFSDNVHTTLAFVHLGEHGDRSFSFYRNPGADLMLHESDVDFQIIDNTKIFHFGSLSMTDEPSKSATLAAVAYARKHHKLISFDPNYRPLLWKSISQARSTIIQTLESVDILKISDNEMELLTGTSDLETGSAALYEMGIQVVLITLGARGCFYRCRDGKGMVPGYAVKTIDTTGAGDAFFGGVLYCLCEKDPTQLARMRADEWEEILRFANGVGALTTTGKGAIPALPSLAEVKALLQNRSNLT